MWSGIKYSQTSSLAALTICTLILSGCAAKQAPYTIEKIEPQFEFEHESLDQILTQELANTPTRFNIAIPDDRYAWERARLFFAEHTSGAKEEVTERETTLSNRDKGADPFIYFVERASSGAGFDYKVQCLSRAPTALNQATRNAQNLARFIREGKIELSMLEK